LYKIEKTTAGDITSYAFLNGRDCYNFVYEGMIYLTRTPYRDPIIINNKSNFALEITNKIYELCKESTETYIDIKIENVEGIITFSLMNKNQTWDYVDLEHIHSMVEYLFTLNGISFVKTFINIPTYEKVECVIKSPIMSLKRDTIFITKNTELLISNYMLYGAMFIYGLKTKNDLKRNMVSYMGNSIFIVLHEGYSDAELGIIINKYNSMITSEPIKIKDIWKTLSTSEFNKFEEDFYPPEYDEDQRFEYRKLLLDIPITNKWGIIRDE
jgi:hypothetical protein